MDTLDYTTNYVPAGHGLTTVGWGTTAISFADCLTPPVEVCDSVPKSNIGWGKKKKDESPMNANYATATVIAADTTEKDQRRFLLNELYEAYDKANMALRRQFGLLDDEAPQTVTETVKRIQDGLFVIPEKHKDTNTWGQLGGYIRWRDPKKTEDKVGYKAANADLDAAFTATKRLISIKSPEDGLQAIIDFETANTPKSPKA